MEEQMQQISAKSIKALYNVIETISHHKQSQMAQGNKLPYAYRSKLSDFLLD